MAYVYILKIYTSRYLIDGLHITNTVKINYLNIYLSTFLFIVIEFVYIFVLLALFKYKKKET